MKIMLFDTRIELILVTYTRMSKLRIVNCCFMPRVIIQRA